MAGNFLRFCLAVLIFFFLLLGVLGWTIEDPKPNKAAHKKMFEEAVQKQVRIVAVRDIIRKKIPEKKKVAVKPKPESERHPQPKKPAQIEPSSAKKPSPLPLKRVSIPPNRGMPKAQPKHRRARKLKSAKLKVNSEIIKTGHRLIDSQKSVPVVLAHYDGIGFENYLQKMIELGGRVFIGDAIEQKILAEVALVKRNGRHALSGLDSGNLQRLRHLATFRPREITGEPLVNKIITHARRFHDSKDIRCVILLPVEREAAFLGALKMYLAEGGYSISEFDLFWGDYINDGSRFSLNVSKGRLRETRDMVVLKLVLSI
jgi:hypothetical protein